MDTLKLILCARGLRSEDGENDEYDRALVELVSDTSGMDRAVTALAIGADASPWLSWGHR